MTSDSGWWKSSEFLVIGELTNLILVIGELRGHTTIVRPRIVYNDPWWDANENLAGIDYTDAPSCEYVMNTLCLLPVTYARGSVKLFLTRLNLNLNSFVVKILTWIMTFSLFYCDDNKITRMTLYRCVGQVVTISFRFDLIVIFYNKWAILEWLQVS